MGERGVFVVLMGISGGYAHKVDGKGRMVLPADFREILGSRVAATVGIGKWRCVAVYSMAQWEEYIARLDEISSTSDDPVSSSEILRYIEGQTHKLDVDSAGRILMPPSLRTYASISQDVWVSGNSRRVEIWDAVLWDEFCKHTNSRIESGSVDPRMLAAI